MYTYTQSNIDMDTCVAYALFGQCQILAIKLSFFFLVWGRGRNKVKGIAKECHSPLYELRFCRLQVIIIDYAFFLVMLYASKVANS